MLCASHRAAHASTGQLENCPSLHRRSFLPTGSFLSTMRGRPLVTGPPPRRAASFPGVPRGAQKTWRRDTKTGPHSGGTKTAPSPRVSSNPLHSPHTSHSHPPPTDSALKSHTLVRQNRRNEANDTSVHWRATARGKGRTVGGNTETQLHSSHHYALYAFLCVIASTRSHRPHL